MFACHRNFLSQIVVRRLLKNAFLLQQLWWGFSDEKIRTAFCKIKKVKNRKWCFSKKSRNFSSQVGLISFKDQSEKYFLTKILLTLFILSVFSNWICNWSSWNNFTIRLSLFKVLIYDNIDWISGIRVLQRAIYAPSKWLNCKTENAQNIPIKFNNLTT